MTVKKEAVKPLPKWVMYRYSTLWTRFKNKEFSHQQAIKSLKETNLVSVIISELKKSGWLTLTLDPKDSRKRLYKLKSPEEAVKELR